jgi:hypothetical protein
MKGNKDVILNAPYMNFDGRLNLVYLTLSKYVEIGSSKKDAVAAVDLNINW